MSSDPRFQHDCDRCRFLGQYGEFDLYACPDNGIIEASIIARYGDDGSEYASMDSAVIRQHQGYMAEHRADVPSTDALLVGLARFSGGEER